MNNEPVAWIINLDGCAHVVLDEDSDSEMRYNGIPLYTHPAKTITDEEILALAYEILETWNTKEAMVEFARAILRKAQEK